MSINLPGYGTAGWGATLNNYLRNLEKRLNVIEGKVNSSSTVEEQILAVSRYAGSGLTSTATKIKRGTSDITYTTAIFDGNILSFENLSYYIQASLTNTGGSYITFDTAKTWTFNENDLKSNQSALLVIDQDGVISLLPKIVNGNATGTTPTNLNFCRLGYVTKLDEDFFFTPAPEIASLSTSSKFEFWSSPKIRTQRQNSNTEYIGNFVFGAEGLGYFTNSNTNNTNNIYINDFNLYNSYQYSDPSGYYAIDKDGFLSYSEYDIDSDDTVDSLFTTVNNKIRFYYVTLTGKAFCYVHEIEDGEKIPITSQELGAYQLSHDQTMGLHVLFDNYSYICPVEVCRLTRNEFGSIVSYSNTYNGFPPQLHNTPIFGSNNAVKWNQFHFMQNTEATEADSLTYNTLSIRPVVNREDGVVNSVVTIDITNSTNTINDEILLMNHQYSKSINLIGSSFSYKLKNAGDPYDIYTASLEDGEVYTVTIEGEATTPVGGRVIDSVTGTPILSNPDGVGFACVVTYTYRGMDAQDCTINDFSMSNIEHHINSYDPSTGILRITLTSRTAGVEVTGYIQKTDSYSYSGIYPLDREPTNCSISGTELGNICTSYAGGISFTLKGARTYGERLTATLTYTYSHLAHDFKKGKICLSSAAADNAYMVWTGSSFLINSGKCIEFTGTDIFITGKTSFNSQVELKNSLAVDGVVNLNNSTWINARATVQELDVLNTVTWTSDRNLKTNITPMVFNSTEFVNSIPLYNYALKSTPNNQTIGLMAQDLQQYLPQLVHEAQDGHLTIEETKLVYICMDALKQANQRIKILEGKVNDLCNKISQYHL